VPTLPASLPPGAHEWEFPVLIGRGETAAFHPLIRMNWTRAKLIIESITLDRVSSEPGIISHLFKERGRPPEATAKEDRFIHP